jgi:hypothetical protein
MAFVNPIYCKIKKNPYLGLLGGKINTLKAKPTQNWITQAFKLGHPYGCTLHRSKKKEHRK